MNSTQVEIDEQPWSLTEQEAQIVIAGALATRKSVTDPCGCYRHFIRPTPAHAWLIREHRPCELHGTEVMFS